MTKYKALWACFFLASCTKFCGVNRHDMTPEQVVEKYLDLSVNMKSVSEKEQLLDLTSGVLYASINAANEETITKAFIDKKFKIEKYSLIERRDRTPAETEITFALEFFDQPNGANDQAGKASEQPKTRTENTVALAKENGKWKIRDVIGKKTSIEFFVTGDVIKPDPAGTTEANPEPPLPEEEGVK